MSYNGLLPAKRILFTGCPLSRAARLAFFLFS